MISPGGLVATLYKSAQIIAAATDQFFGSVVMLLNGDGNSVLDRSQNHAFTQSYGALQSVTSPVKYGTGAIYFDGSSYGVFPPLANYSIGTNNFTIECWVYPLAYGGTIVGGSLFHANSGSQNGYCMNLGENQSRFRFISRGTGGWADNVIVSAGNGPALNTWTHTAVVRNGTTLKIYINGVERGTANIAAGFNLSGSATNATVGYFSDGGTTRYFNGYIDDLRVTNGVARYTGAFTPPTAALPTI